MNLLEVGEQVCIEYLGTISAIEALDEGVLIWLARLDIADRNAFCGSLFGKGLGDYLRAFIQAYCVRGPWQSIKRPKTRPRRAEGMDTRVLALPQLIRGVADAMFAAQWR